MAIPAGQILEIKRVGHCLLSNGRSEQVSQVYHYESLSPVTLFNIANVINWFIANVDAALLALTNTSYTTDYVSGRDLVRDDTLETFQGVAAPGTGPSTDRLPLDNSMCAVLHTHRRGRGSQGRKFIGPVTEAETLLDELTAAAYANWDAAFGNFITPAADGVGNTWNPVVLSRGTLVYTAHVLQSYRADVIYAKHTNHRICRQGRRREKVG